MRFAFLVSSIALSCAANGPVIAASFSATAVFDYAFSSSDIDQLSIFGDDSTGGIVITIDDGSGLFSPPTGNDTNPPLSGSLENEIEVDSSASPGSSALAQTRRTFNFGFLNMSENQVDLDVEFEGFLAFDSSALGLPIDEVNTAVNFGYTGTNLPNESFNFLVEDTDSGTREFDIDTTVTIAAGDSFNLTYLVSILSVADTPHTPAPIPLPGSVFALGAALAGLGSVRFFRRKNTSPS